MRSQRTRRPKFFTVTVPRTFEPNRDRVIGVAVAHPDRKGMNVFLDAVPIQGQFTIRDPLASIEYGRADGSDLHPVNWPPAHVGTNIKLARLALKLATRKRK